MEREVAGDAEAAEAADVTDVAAGPDGVPGGSGASGAEAGAGRSDVYVGNAVVDGAGDRGWLLGHFKPVGDPRRTEDVEIKWSVHPVGDTRAAWVRGERRTALLVLVSGRFRVELPGRDVVLAEQGDYLVWGPGVDHSWYAEEESVVMTVRWPSLPGYAVDGAGGAGSPAPAVDPAPPSAP